MKSKPILIKKNKIAQKLEILDPSKNLFSESWLQELIQSNPQILPVDDIEPVFWPLVSIGREIPTRSGPIDNLFISESGYPVLVETKLWRNSEAKREVIAQALDYAGELSKWSFEDLDQAARKRNNKGVLDLIQESISDLDLEKIPSEDDIAKNLRLGRILILIVSDHIRNSLIDMLEYVNKNPHLATNVGLVELKCYQMPENEADIFVVPNIVAKTEIVERSIVQVMLHPDQPHSISVVQTKEEPNRKRVHNSLTEEVFWEGIKQQSPKSLQAMQKIFNHFQSNPLVNLQMRQSGIVIRSQCPDSDQSVSVLILYINGTVECWPDTLKFQLKKGNLDTKIGENYLSDLERVLKQKSKNGRNFFSAEKINAEELFVTTDSFIQAVSTAVPLTEDQII
ncbi:MAG: hypothetical protein C0410_14720 [Anaerolinea sp.]|nr:hypothetical protein [Anaerolinea sp.]